MFPFGFFGRWEKFQSNKHFGSSPWMLFSSLTIRSHQSQTWPGANEEASGVFHSVNDRELLLLPSTSRLLQMNEGFWGDRAAILTDAVFHMVYLAFVGIPRE